MSAAPGGDRLLTITEVADRLRAPVATIRWWRANGEGPRAARIGRRVLFLESDVETWLAAQFDREGDR